MPTLPSSAPRSGVVSDDYAAIAALIAEEFKEIPSDITKKYKREAIDLAAKLHNLQKAYERRDRTAKDLSALSEKRIPQGSKPFSAPFETPLLDSLVMNETVFNVMAPPGTSIRNARKMVYIEQMRVMKHMDEMAIGAQISELKRWCKMFSFLDRCASAHAEKSVSAAVLGLDEDYDVLAGPLQRI